MNFIEKNLDKLMLFSLAIAALFLYGYNQTTDMKTLAAMLLGGFIGYVTNTIKNTVVLPAGSEKNKEVLAQILED